MTNKELELIMDLTSNNFEIYTLKQEKSLFADYDKEIIEDMERLNCDIILYNSLMARSWYFSNINALIDYFDNGGRVGFDNANTKIA